MAIMGDGQRGSLGPGPATQDGERGRGHTLGSLSRGLSALELLGDRGEVRLADLARELGTSRATAFRLLSTLQARGYVEHVRRDHTYRLGTRLRLLAARADRPAIVRLAEPAMAELRAATGETINLAAVNGRRLVYEAVLEGGYALRTLPGLGQTVAMHSSSLGKAVLAGLPSPQRDLILGPEPYTRFTERTITERSALDTELARTSERGYATDDEETELGLACVGAAINGPDGRPWAAISISGLTDRMRRWDRDELGGKVRALCEAVSAELSPGRLLPK